MTLVLSIILLIILFSLVAVLNVNKPVKPRFSNARSIDKDFVKSKWQEIETTSNLGGPSNYKASIMEADKLVDYVLKAKGFRGETFGERLKNAQKKFPNYNDYNNLWFSHKVRNNIAHEATHDLNSTEAKRAIEYFKKALKELGAL